MIIAGFLVLDQTTESQMYELITQLRKLGVNLSKWDIKLHDMFQDLDDSNPLSFHPEPINKLLNARSELRYKHRHFVLLSNDAHLKVKLSFFFPFILISELGTSD